MTCWTVWTLARPLRATLRKIIRHLVHHHAAHALLIATVVCVGAPLMLWHLLPPMTVEPFDPALPRSIPDPGVLAVLPGLVALILLRRRAQ
jgi:hypothetical protein